MAGAGYKLFNTGDVLTASDVNTYLQQQVVMVFASSAARSSALTGVLAEGMVTYLQDTNSVQVYNGTAFVAVGGSSPLTTKGDLYTFSTTDARLPVGTNGQVLTADSSEATGLKFATPAGGGANFTLLNSGGTALTGSNEVTISAITGANDIFVYVSPGSANASSNISFRFNSDSGTNYIYGGLQPSNSDNYYDFVTDGTSMFAGQIGNSSSNVLAVFMSVRGCNSSGGKVINLTSSGNGTNFYSAVYQGLYTGASTISSLTIRSSSGNFDEGTIFVYTSA